MLCNPWQTDGEQRSNIIIEIYLKEMSVSHLFTVAIISVAAGAQDAS